MIKILYCIVVHDKRIIDHFEKENKYKNFENYVYLLVGNHNEDFSSEKIIQCNKLPNNIEHNKNYLVYTAMYALAKNINIIPEDINYVFFLEYDVTLDSTNVIKNVEETNESVYGVSIMPIEYCINKQCPFSSGLVNYLIHKRVKEIKKQDCLSTNTVLLKKQFLIDYFNDSFTLDFLDYLNNNEYSGHYLERYLSIYCILKNIKYIVIDCKFEHSALDSHNTQGRYENKYLTFEKTL
jgi:hypothetical protein